MQQRSRSKTIVPNNRDQLWYHSTSERIDRRTVPWFIKPNGTSVNSDYAISQLQYYGINATSLSDYNGTDVINQLRKGNRIIYMRGDGRYYHVWVIFRKYVDGHAWVVDGYIRSIKGWDVKYYLHCNWGWDGNKNGYFLRDIFDTEEGPAYYDDGTPTRSYSNYQYNLKTSVICK